MQTITFGQTTFILDRAVHPGEIGISLGRVTLWVPCADMERWAMGFVQHQHPDNWPDRVAHQMAAQGGFLTPPIGR